MFQKMFTNLIPVLFQKLKAIPKTEKQKFADVVGDLCISYALGDRAMFDEILDKSKLSEEIKANIRDSLWNEDSN